MGYVIVNLVPEFFLYISYVPCYLGSPLRAEFLLNHLYIPKAPIRTCMQQTLNKYFWNKLKYLPMNIGQGTTVTQI